MKRRAAEEFNISFLDVICCGFGAIILLLMITKTVAPQLIEVSAISLQSRIEDMQKQIFELRGETQILNRDLNARQEQLSHFNERIAILQGELDTLNAKYEASSIAHSANTETITELAIARQKLTEEMKRLLNQQTSKNNLIGGIPVDSEYIIFIIDTSGSMFNYAWPRMLKEFNAVLKIHPSVKGVQVLNDMGNYMFSRYRGKWIPDTPGRRKIIIDRLRTWNVFSNSSPAEGITRAIRSFYEPGKKISVYVFGDEFSGESITSVVDAIDKINREDSAGKRMVRIHAVGFPVQFFNQPHLQITGIRFATLMRELTFRNGGSFVGLNDFR